MNVYYENRKRIIRYRYQENRDLQALENSFLINTFMTLDHLVKTKALIITYKDEGKMKTVDVMHELLNNSKEVINIIQADNNFYSGKHNTIGFYDTHGTKFRKNHRKKWFGNNVGYNSPMAVFAHELIHCYNELFETQEYHDRRNDKHMHQEKITPGGHNLSYPNAEEEFVIQMTNQVIKRLGEDTRTNYGRNYYPTASPITTRKKGKKRPSIARIFGLSKRAKF